VKVQHRRTQVREESWPLIDGWYWCPENVVEDRISEEAIENDPSLIRRAAWSFEWMRWVAGQWALERRLAHQCEDGSISAPEWVQMYEKKRGGVSLYGRCKKCREKLSTGVKTIIIMEKVL
jgi:hypothetical protein